MKKNEKIRRKIKLKKNKKFRQKTNLSKLDRKIKSI